jgi:DNA-binding beta-propeller fold protein YncE
VVAKLPVGHRARDLAFTQDGSRLFVSGENDASLTVIDVPAWKVLKSVRLAGELVRPNGLVVSPDGKRAYVTTGRGHD